MVTEIRYESFPEYDTAYDDLSIEMENITEEEFDKELLNLLGDDFETYTVYYEYDATGNRTKLIQGSYVKTYEPNDYDFSINSDFYKYYQCFIKEQPIEPYFENEIGYLPKEIIFEICNHVSVSVIWNAEDKKYYLIQ